MKLLTDKQYTLHKSTSAYIISLSSDNLINREPFVMAGGDILNAGDKIISTDKGKGAAGTHGIKVDDGWYQKYEGKVLATHENFLPSVFILFSAYTVKDEDSVFGEFDLGDHVYIAYVEILGSLFSCRGGASHNVSPCKSVERFY